MKKRLIALFCLAAVFLGVFAFGATAASDGDGLYDVGYANVDVNPWIKTSSVYYLNPGNSVSVGIPDNSANWKDLQQGATVNNVITIDVSNPSKPGSTIKVPFVKVPMAGYGTYASASCESLLDDNGDGVIGLGDGLHATATSVTDDWGSTVIYITIDSIGGYAGLTTSLRQSIPAALKELTGKDVITADKIMVSANHSHNAVNIDTCRAEYLKYENGTHVNQDEDGNATTALGAYFQHYLKTVTDAAVQAYQNAVPATMSKGAIDVSNALGYQMNFVRHYNVKATDKSGKVESGLVKGPNFGPTAGDAATKKVSYVAGSAAYKSHLYEADDMLYVLKFTPKNTSIKPVVFVNWRAHSTIVSGSSKTYLSADYASSLRRFMENAGYRPAFWQGAAGNIVPSSSDPTIKASSNSYYWVNIRRTDLGITFKTSESSSSNHNLTYQAVLYGKLLTEATVKCLESKMTNISAGPIRTKQFSFTANTQEVEQGSGMAAAALYWESLGKPKNNVYPLKYKYTDGKTYILNSYFHANNMLNSYKSSTKTATYELNAITLGEGVAMVTSPCEMFDRYDLGGSNAAANNDWLELIADSYGTPFVLGYSNQHGPYLSNVSGFHYNENATNYGAGCYEANTSLPAEGTGEAVIQSYKTMLKAVSEGFIEKKCSACQKVVTWEPIYSSEYKAKIDKYGFTDGHYYLMEDVFSNKDASVPEGAIVCLDLNGHTLESDKRVFNLPYGATLNLIDSVGTGSVNATMNGSNPVGGMTVVAGTLNIYGGSYRLIKTDVSNGTAAGGLFSVQTGAHLNVYGGTLYGANLTGNLYNYTAKNGCGSAIYLYAGGNLLVGGDARIVSGTVPTHGKGTCVYAHNKACRITLQGSANVDEIYLPEVSGSSLTVKGVYTGAVKLCLNPNIALTYGMNIGTSVNADLSRAKVSIANDAAYGIVVSGSNLLIQRFPEATINGANYSKLRTALAVAKAGQTVVLHLDITDAITVPDKAILIDLNGHDMRSVTVTGSAVSFKDSQTDDISVADGCYGEIATIVGTANAADGYIKVTDGATSFHKINLSITAMSLRASVAGVYYKSNFQTDAVAEKFIKQYGIALSVIGEPDETNMGTTSAYTYLTNFANGDVTGTLLKNIMNPGNTDVDNNNNANTAIYGRPYILTKDGQYIFGDTVQRSLKQQVEAVDEVWGECSGIARETMLLMYNRFKNVMSGWNIPNIKRDAG